MSMEYTLYTMGNQFAIILYLFIHYTFEFSYLMCPKIFFKVLRPREAGEMVFQLSFLFH